MDEITKILEDAVAKKEAAKKEADFKTIADGVVRKIAESVEPGEVSKGVIDNLSKSIQPAIEQLLLRPQITPEDIARAVSAVQISVPEVKMPEIPAPVVHVAAPVVNVPAPIVNIPETKFPKFPEFPGEFSIRGVNRKAPFPVIMMGLDGKPMNFAHLSGGATGGRGDFFAIRDIQNSSGGSLIDNDGFLKVTGSFTVSAAGASSVSLINSDGTYYNSDNPLPVSATIALPAGPGDGATATRFIQAGDSVSSVNVLQINGNTPATGLNETNAGVLRVVTMSDTASSMNIALIGGTAPSKGNNVTDAGTLRVTIMTDTSVSTNVVAFNGNAPAQGLNETVAGVLRVALMTDVIASVNVAQYGGVAPSVGLNETTNGVQRVAIMTDVVASVYANNPSGPGDAATALRVVLAGNADSSVSVTSIAGPIGPGDAAAALRVTIAGNAGESVSITDFNGSAPATGLNETTNGVLRVVQMTDATTSTQNKIIAMTALPTAVGDAATTFQRSDKLGRSLSRPVQVRELITTAYTTLSNGTETTLATASAGQYLDLISVILANTSTAAVQVDIRAGSGGNIVQSLQIPASATTGWTPPVPWPQDATGNAWTADMGDITNSNVLISALFSKES